MTERRTQEERREATRGALISAARSLFAEKGYVGASQEEIVGEAGVTRGALYHHFEGGKIGLFREIVIQIQDDLEAEILAAAKEEFEASGDVFEGCMAGTLAYFDACTRPEIQRTLMEDGASVLGWEEWYEIDARYGIAQQEQGLSALIEGGIIEEQPVRPLADMLYGAILEAATYVLEADDTEKARSEVEIATRKLFSGLRSDGEK